jgi:hypothetical protein
MQGITTVLTGMSEIPFVDMLHTLVRRNFLLGEKEKVLTELRDSKWKRQRESETDGARGDRLERQQWPSR